jgi:hypothetical protein
VPGVLEYTPLPGTERWRVEKFELFEAEFSIGGGAAAMVHFHELGLQHTRPWLICRRLFGIGPMIPSADAHPDDLRPHSRAEICAALGLETADLQAELDGLRTVWREFCKREMPEPTHGENPLTPALSPDGGEGDLKFGDELLREYGFPESMFRVMVWDPVTKTEVARASEENKTERDWFVRRVHDWKKMLGEPTAGQLVRNALINELFLKRYEREMSVLSPASPKWDKFSEGRQAIETAYQEQLLRLQEIFPDMVVAGKISFRAALSDMNQAHRDYYGSGDRRRLDKINTAGEIEVLLRMSAQRPEPQYRFGLNVAIVEAMHSLYDPNFRSQFRPATLRMLDAGFKKAVMEMREAQNEPLVDLEKGVLPGEGDDFPDIPAG